MSINEIFTNTIIKNSRDISCNIYNNLITSRLSFVATKLVNSEQVIDNLTNTIISRPLDDSVKSLTDQAKIRGYFLPELFTTNIGNNYAGARFSKVFPSSCEGCTFSDNASSCVKKPEYGVYNQLLLKKGYIFQNTKGSNVISGPITYNKDGKQEFLLQFGGLSGAALTKNKQLSNLGKGLTNEGKPGKRFGVQTFISGRPIQYSNSNIFEATQPTFNSEISTIFNNPRPFIPICVVPTKITAPILVIINFYIDPITRLPSDNRLNKQLEIIFNPLPNGDNWPKAGPLFFNDPALSLIFNSIKAPPSGGFGFFGDEGETPGTINFGLAVEPGTTSPNTVFTISITKEATNISNNFFSDIVGPTFSVPTWYTFYKDYFSKANFQQFTVDPKGIGELITKDNIKINYLNLPPEPVPEPEPQLLHYPPLGIYPPTLHYPPLGIYPPTLNE